jgi:retinol dehydrogenase-12
MAGVFARWLTSFFYSQFLVTLPYPTKDLTGQTIIVTGSNAGLGLEAARHISRLNASLLILAVRNTSRGNAAKESILASTGRPENSIEVWELDLQSFDSVKAFAKRAESLQCLDACLENAGFMNNHFELVAGYESTITTNVIGTFLLALLLLPKLKESANNFNTQPRLSIVTSEMHFLAQFPEQHADDIFAALNNEKSVIPGERCVTSVLILVDTCLKIYTHISDRHRYEVSKLLEVFVVRKLDSLLKQGDKASKVIVNCMTPGFCNTNFGGNLGLIVGMMKAVVGRTADAGSRALVAGIIGGEETCGAYMADCKVAQYVISSLI